MIVKTNASFTGHIGVLFYMQKTEQVFIIY